MYRFAFVIFFVFAITESTNAQFVHIPDINVPATGTVVSFETVEDWLPTDSLAISADGISCTLQNCELELNASGILSRHTFDPTLVGTIDAQVYSYQEGAHQGALILSNQSRLDGLDRPWIQLIRPTVENGLGTTSVPSLVSSSRTLAEYGGFLAEPIPAGTTLYLSTADFNHSDNSGSDSVTTVPEPNSAILVGLLLIGITARNRRPENAG